jgi:hypothetical protein
VIGAGDCSRGGPRIDVECTCGLSVDYPLGEEGLRRETIEDIAALHARRHGCRVSLTFPDGTRVTISAAAGKL